jgi:hypothetical protein
MNGKYQAGYPQAGKYPCKKKMVMTDGINVKQVQPVVCYLPVQLPEKTYAVNRII